MLYEEMIDTENTEERIHAKKLCRVYEDSRSSLQLNKKNFKESKYDQINFVTSCFGNPNVHKVIEAVKAQQIKQNDKIYRPPEMTASRASEGQASGNLQSAQFSAAPEKKNINSS